jgi:hypothetical protein
VEEAARRLTLGWKICLKQMAATRAEKKGSSALTMCVKLTAALAAAAAAAASPQEEEK